jgi:hypothetical protein
VNPSRSVPALRCDLAPEALRLGVGEAARNLEVFLGERHDQCDVLRAPHEDDLLTTLSPSTRALSRAFASRMATARIQPSWPYSQVSV